MGGRRAAPGRLGRCDDARRNACNRAEPFLVRKSRQTPGEQPANGDYAFRRISEVRILARNCSGVTGGLSALLRFIGTGSAAFAVLRAASRSSCLAAKSFALASIGSAVEPSRPMRCSWASTDLQ